jgi:hypothetical protein
VFGSDGLLVFDLPSAVAPGATMRFKAGLRVSPWAVSLEVKPNGEGRIFPDNWEAEEPGIAVTFDGIMWVPGDS